jgi:anti-sigma factor (TIGR02949 family)
VPRYSRARLIRNCYEGFTLVENDQLGNVSLLVHLKIQVSVVTGSGKSGVIEIDCYTVRRELSDYLDGDLANDLLEQVERHLQHCKHCTAVYDGLRNVVKLLADGRALELPVGFSQRLHRRLFQ